MNDCKLLKVSTRSGELDKFAVIVDISGFRENFPLK